MEIESKIFVKLAPRRLYEANKKHRYYYQT